MITLKKIPLRRIENGHPWIFDNEIDSIAPELLPGDSTEVYTFNKKYLGSGLFNPASKITVRLYSREKEIFDHDLLNRRILAAWEYRKQNVDIGSCRIVFGEADLLPGLIIDKFEDVIVVQTLTLSMENLKNTIFSILAGLFRPRAIIEKNDAVVRKKEGLPVMAGIVYGNCERIVTITENNIRFTVDLLEGQKTGHYLDQKENHAAIQKFCADKSVLDVCTHTGGFALHAARYGARRITAVDISGEAIAAASRNAELNSASDRIEFIEANAFDYLRSIRDRRFDLIILDPPPFCKSKSAARQAAKGYKELNLQAFRLLNEGGVLVSCSCSYHMTEPYFKEVVAEAAHDAGRTVLLNEFRSQGKDHPILLGFPESHYLKCGIYIVRS